MAKLISKRKKRRSKGKKKVFLSMDHYTGKILGLHPTKESALEMAKLYTSTTGNTSEVRHGYLKKRK